MISLDTRRLALSQHCLCGRRVKKDLSTRVHVCTACGLNPLDRDLFSAFLAYLCARHSVTDLSTGSLNRAGNRRKAQQLCAPGRAPVPARLARTESRQESAGSESRWSDPADKTRALTRKRPGRRPQSTRATAPRDPPRVGGMHDAPSLATDGG